MIKIWAYGDSFVAGDQDDPKRIDAIPEIMEYNRYNFSFAAHLAKNLGIDIINRAISGCSNFVQLDKLFKDAASIAQDDIVIFGISSPLRDRFQIPLNYPEFVKDTRGPTLGDRDLFSKKNIHCVPTVDMFYLLSSIEKIEKLYNIKIIKINAFHNFMEDCPLEENHKFQFANYLGLNKPNNTLLDVLIDNWLGTKKLATKDHNKWTPPEEYKIYFTRKSHPSAEGHKKIAIWMYERLKNDYNYPI